MKRLLTTVKPYLSLLAAGCVLLYGAYSIWLFYNEIYQPVINETPLPAVSNKFIVPDITTPLEDEAEAVQIEVQSFPNPFKDISQIGKTSPGIDSTVIGDTET